MCTGTGSGKNRLRRFLPDGTPSRRGLPVLLSRDPRRESGRPSPARRTAATSSGRPFQRPPRGVARWPPVRMPENLLNPPTVANGRPPPHGHQAERASLLAWTSCGLTPLPSVSGGRVSGHPLWLGRRHQLQGPRGRICA